MVFVTRHQNNIIPKTSSTPRLRLVTRYSILDHNALTRLIVTTRSCGVCFFFGFFCAAGLGGGGAAVTCGGNLCGGVAAGLPPLFWPFWAVGTLLTAVFWDSLFLLRAFFWATVGVLSRTCWVFCARWPASVDLPRAWNRKQVGLELKLNFTVASGDNTLNRSLLLSNFALG